MRSSLQHAPAPKAGEVYQLLHIPIKKNKHQQILYIVFIMMNQYIIETNMGLEPTSLRRVFYLLY